MPILCFTSSLLQPCICFRICLCSKVTNNINNKFWEFSASEMIVTRSFPVGSLVKEKKIGVQYLQHLEQWLHECIQLRSSTFQVVHNLIDNETSCSWIVTSTNLSCTVISLKIGDMYSVESKEWSSLLSSTTAVQIWISYIFHLYSVD